MFTRQRLAAVKIVVLAAFAIVSMFSAGPKPASAEASLTFESASAGYAHTCALSDEGGVWCWGLGSLGQRGDGTSNYGPIVPVGVLGLSSEVTAVAAGSHHACALTLGGEVKCWGSNQDGQLGGQANDNCGTDASPNACSTMPVDVTGLEAGIAAIAGGGYHTCALTIEGGVACWGSNEYGQLGDGTTTDSTAPVEVLDAQGEPWTGITQVTAGAGHTCALTSADGVLCWGENDHGQLGNGTQNDVDYPTPAAVIGLDSGISAVISSATSTHTCALTTEGSLKCWGSNASGQLGDGTSGENNLSTVPVDVVDLEATATAITLGGAFGLGRGHTCALTAATTVKCWGYNGWSQLGNGTRFGPDIPTPNAVCEKFDEVLHECTEGLSSVVGVTAGGFHTCALPEAGGAKCWGTCVAGQLGAIPCPEAATPLDVSLDSDGDGMHDSYEMERDCLNWKVDDGTSDADGDGLENLAEFEERTNPCVQDTDGDGCTDWQETVLHHLSRGAHNPLNFWDFYDTPDVNNVRDRMVNVADIGRVVARFGARGDATADPLSPPPPAPAYHPAFDRNQDRNIDIGDISLTVYQFGLSCA